MFSLLFLILGAIIGAFAGFHAMQESVTLWIVVTILAFPFGMGMGLIGRYLDLRF